MKIIIKILFHSFFSFSRNEYEAEYNYFNYFQKWIIYAKTFQLTFLYENKLNLH